MKCSVTLAALNFKWKDSGKLNCHLTTELWLSPFACERVPDSLDNLLITLNIPQLKLGSFAKTPKLYTKIIPSTLRHQPIRLMKSPVQ